MSDYLIFGGFNTSSIDVIDDLTVYIFRENEEQIAERRIEEIIVPGRNGVVVNDLGSYENVDIDYSFIVNASNKSWLSAGVIAFINKLKEKFGYQRLSDSFRTDNYYKAVLKDIRLIYSEDRKSAKGTLEFSRLPQVYRNGGDNEVEITSASYTLNSLNSYERGTPLIRVYGNGSFSVNSNAVTVSNNSTGYIDIDSEAQDCYDATSNRNGDVVFASGEFPELVPGENVITLSGVSKLVVTPRWWRL